MLEVLYDKEAKEVRGWCADPAQFGNFNPSADQEVVELPIGLETIPPGNDFWVDLASQTIIGDPSYKPAPPHSTHYAKVESFNVSAIKPLTVKRNYRGYEYIFDCFVTEGIKDLFLAGNLAVGDFVLVHFDDIGEQIVTAKIYKSW